MATTPAVNDSIKWPQMNGSQRLAWWGKFLIALFTFGFAFPRIMEPRLRDESFNSKPPH